jgi:hypothetical protein
MSRRRKAPLNPLFLPSFRGGRWKVLAPWLKIWRIMTCKLLFMRSETIDSLSMSTSVVDMHGRMLRGHGNSLRSRSAKFHSSSDSIIKRALGKYIKLQLALKGTTATANGIFICFNFVMSAVKLLLPWFSSANSRQLLVMKSNKSFSFDQTPVIAGKTFWAALTGSAARPNDLFALICCERASERQKLCDCRSWIAMKPAFLSGDWYWRAQLMQRRQDS